MIYGDDLAFVHHDGFGDFAESAAPGLLEILWRHGIMSGLVIDVGCGSGIWARELTRAGYDVIAVDPSPSMLAIAKTIAPKASLECGDLVAALQSKRSAVNAITAIGEILNYAKREDLPKFFAQAARALTRNGILIFDLAESEAYPPYDEHRVDGDDWAVFVREQKNGTHLTRRITIFRQGRRSEEVHELELYPRAEIVAMLRAAGFHVRIRRSYGTRRLPPGHVVYVAKRRETW